MPFTIHTMRECVPYCWEEHRSATGSSSVRK